MACSSPNNYLELTLKPGKLVINPNDIIRRKFKCFQEGAIQKLRSTCSGKSHLKVPKAHHLYSIKLRKNKNLGKRGVM